MTTSVDILFKELPAPSQANDRISRPDTASARSDYGQDRSSVSKKDEYRSEKTFSEHLNDHDAARTQGPNNRTKTKSEDGDEDGRKNNTIVNSEEKKSAVSTSKPEPKQETQGLENEAKPVIVSDDKTLTDDIAAHTENNAGHKSKIVQTVSTKDLLTTEVTTEQTVISNGTNSAANPDVSSVKDHAIDVTEGQPNNDKQDPATGIENAALNNNENAKQHSPVFNNDPVVVPVENNSNPQRVAQVESHNKDQSQNKIIETTDTALQSKETQVLEGDAAGTPLETGQKTKVIDVSTAELQNTNASNDEPQTTEANTSAMVAVTKEEIPITPAIENAAPTAETIVAESGKLVPVTQLKEQKISNGTPSEKSDRKGGAAAAVNENSKATNKTATGTANQQAYASVASPVAATKSDIQLDLGIGAQNFDTVLPQTTTPNGQPAMTTSGLLATQDVNSQQSISHLASTVKTAAGLDAKMINEQITVAINKNVVKGLNNFSIRLHPVELGQVDVRLEFMADGKMNAAVMVENEKTLTMLQRDQANLAKALQDAGINLTNKNLDFSLMKQGGQNNGQEFAGYNRSNHSDAIQDEMSNMAPVHDIRMGYSNQTIDISV